MAYQKLQPKIIALDELPPDGREFVYTNDSGELNRDVQDVVGANSYELRFFLKPIGNAFEMRGEFRTELNLVCSRCAIDFRQPVHEKFHEILMVEDSRPRGSHSSRANHASDLLEGGPYANMLAESRFDVGEFLHEIIALAEPIQPMGKGQCDDTCENYQQALREGWLQAIQAPEPPPAETHNPFAVLKRLKN